MNGALMQLTHPANFDSWPEGWRAQDLQSFVRMAQRDFHITQTPSADGRHYLSDAGGNFVRRAFEKYGGAAGGFVEDRVVHWIIYLSHPPLLKGSLLLNILNIASDTRPLPSAGPWNIQLAN